MRLIGLCECGCGEATVVSPRNSALHGYVKGQPRRFVKGHNQRGTSWDPGRRERVVAALTGREHSEERRTAISRGRRGDQPLTYSGLHQWVSRSKTKTGRCSECGHEGKTDWANLSGEYAHDLDDYREMCRSCHRLYDLGKLCAS